MNYDYTRADEKRDREIIRVTTKDGEKVEGTGWYVEDHIDNPKDEYALIIVCAPREYDGFNESEIKTIEVL